MTENMAARGEGLAGLVKWLREQSEEVMKSAIARESTAETMRAATPKELREAKALAEKMAGRKLPNVSTGSEEAKIEADVQCMIAAKLSDRARKISAWADELAAAAPAGTAGICPICYHSSAALATPSPQALPDLFTPEVERLLEKREAEMDAGLVSTPYICTECMKLDKNWYGPCPHAPAATQEPAGSASQWNIEQILVYMWQCIGGEDSDPKEYPYSQFAESEGGKLLRAQMEGLAGSPRKVGEDGTGRHCEITGTSAYDCYTTQCPDCPYPEFKLSREQAINAICLQAAEIVALKAALSRSSSVPVGEQKQEDGV